ncbi:metalloproteinase-16-like [Octopus vulgaris]|uniref:Metalloproteinase-16-like n=1 Tax=Octopus vulgaris TaxID=6645 RepID=A0AA36APB1_OCTVU|nr:metalloproteinase-16-like [Octopus vulgaris]
MRPGENLNIINIHEHVFHVKCNPLNHVCYAQSKIDLETKRVMQLPRCGVADRISYGNSARKKRYTIQGSKWKTRELTYRILRAPSGLSHYEVEREIRRAFKVWSDVTSLTFKQLVNRNTDIDVMFASHEHGDRHPFDGIGGTLAHAFFPEFGGDAHFDDSEPWSVDSWKGVNLFQVAAHEIGHSLGLAHSDVNDALMAPFYRGYKPNFKLSRDDIAAVQELYGSRSDSRFYPRPPDPLPTQGRMSGPPICHDASIDAITKLPDDATYVFKGDKYYRLSGTGIDVGYPRKIEWDWLGVTGPIDAAFTWDNSFTFIFKGDEYWKFDHMKAVSGYPRKIRDGFKGVPDNIDAAFVWGGNGKTYFIKGQLYWRWAKYGVDFGYPKQLNVWVNLPSRVTAVFKWQNGKTYFFKDDDYYRFNDKNFRVDEGYPRKVSTWWLGCNDDTQNQMHHNVHSIITAHPSILNPSRTRKPPRGSQDENENLQTKLQITQNEAYRTNCHISLLLTTFFTIVFFLRQ